MHARTQSYHSERSVRRTASRTFSTKLGDTESSSIPILRNRSVSVVSAASSPPQIAQAPISIECKVTEILPQGSHDMFIAEITSVNIAKDLIDEKGKLHIEKAGLMAYAHGTYFALGKKIGTFGFSVKPKRTKKPHKDSHKKKKK